MPQTTSLDPALAPVLPLTASINAAGHLAIGGCDTVALAREFGTPLYVFDEADIRSRCQEFLHEFRSRLPDTTVLYAGKAFLIKAVAQVVAEEGMGLDVASGGELAIAQAAGFPLDRVYLHGNNKSAAELEAAVAAGIGHIVVDNFGEIELLDAITRRLGKRQAVLIRVTPNVDPHTHHHISTGMADSKFGFPLSDGIALTAARRIVEKAGLELVGVHCHIGSQLQETDPHRQAVAVALAFAGELRRELGIEIREFSPGGGVGIQYLRDAEQPPVAAFAEAITSAVREACDRHGMPVPRLVIEPGRSTVGRAGVALYTVGARKEIPGVRTYVSVDGGMADNIRPAIYGARYEALSAERPAAANEETVTIAGKYCESGDILIRDIALPRLAEGEVVAVPASGAYCLAMASNYNASLRPAVVFVRDGKARLVRRRETYADLLACDVD